MGDTRADLIRADLDAFHREHPDLLEIARRDTVAASSALAAISDDGVKSRWLVERRGGVMLRFAPLLHGLSMTNISQRNCAHSSSAAPETVEERENRND